MLITSPLASEDKDNLACGSTDDVENGATKRNDMPYSHITCLFLIGIIFLLLHLNMCIYQ